MLPECTIIENQSVRLCTVYIYYYKMGDGKPFLFNQGKYGPLYSISVVYPKMQWLRYGAVQDLL